MNTTRTIGLLAAALAALLVTACGGTTSPPSAGSAGSTEHNDADVTFVQGMIPHHTQAVAMAQMATGQATSPQVKDLAARIQKAQGPEIEQLRGLLGSWGVAEAADVGGTGGMDQGGMSAMSGMMTPDQMIQLGQASGNAFDRLFLQMMTAHHTGAVAMAETELRDGRSSDAKALAQRILDAQRGEITEMKGLLTTL